MGKVIFWLVVFFAFLLVLRLVNVAKQKRNRPAEPPPPGRLPETMVRCHDCGVYLPREEAQATLRGFRCRDGQCETRKSRTH
jgi:hypothetical protein